MLTVLSPAKSLNFETPTPSNVAKWVTQPQFVAQAQQLNRLLRKLDVPQLAQLMSISDKLASLNVARNHEWSPEFSLDNSKPAILAFDGDVYDGFDAQSLTIAELKQAQSRIRILSGLYGVIRPLDLLQAYRLEMGTKLANAKGGDLYAFWGHTLAKHIHAELNEHTHKVLIHLASDEYFKAVPLSALGMPVVAPVFKDLSKGNYKIISFFAKRARGAMARFIVQHKIDTPEGLKQFAEDGYYFVGEATTKNGVHQLIFHRD
jgi:hypothetical protein